MHAYACQEKILPCASVLLLPCPARDPAAEVTQSLWYKQATGLTVAATTGQLGHMRSAMRRLLKYTLVIFATLGLYRACLTAQHGCMRSTAQKIESERSFEPDLLYRKDGGEPLILTRPDARTTLLFLEGFRAQAPAGMYADYLRELQAAGVNIIAPVYGLQSSPFDLRNRDWHIQEDMRTVTQIYDTAAALLPRNDRLVVLGQSFGALPALAVAAKAKRKPDAIILLSPLNSGLEFKAAGPVVFWLSQQTRWLQHLLLYTRPGIPPGRESEWDIVNAEMNRRMAATGWVNPEDSARYGHQVEQSAQWLESVLLPQVKEQRILMRWGDSDLFFSQSGFARFCEKLGQNANQIDCAPLRDTGHMVLLDNGAAQLKTEIRATLQH